MAANVLQVYVFRDGEFLGTEVFVESEIVVGRDPDVVDLPLDSAEISREHARIKVQGGKIFVEDLGSTNGVLVSGAKVDRAEVTRFDEISIGEYSLKLKFAPQKKRAAPKADPTVAVPTGAVQRAPDLDDDEAVDDEEDDIPPPPPVKKPQAAAKKKAEPAPAPAAAPVAAKKTAPAPERKPAPELLEERSTVRGEVSPALLAKTRLDDEPTTVTPSPSFAGAAAASASRAGSADSPVGVALAPGVVEEDEHADDHDDAPPLFDIIREVKSEDRAPLPGQADWLPRLEVIGWRVDGVAHSTLLPPGGSFYVGPNMGFLARRPKDIPERVRLLQVSKDGASAITRLRPSSRGTIRQKNGESTPLGPTDGKGTGPVLRPGDVADIVDGPTTYHVRFTRVPPPVKDTRSWKERLKPDKALARSAGGSVGGHVALMIILSILAGGPPAGEAVKKEEFVEVTLDQKVELEEPPPEPPPEEPPPTPQEIVAPAVDNPAPSKSKRAKAGGLSAGPPGVLGLLSKRGSSLAPGPQSVMAAASNLSSAKVGGMAGYRVSGLQSNVPSSGISVGGGGGGPMTTGASAMLRGGGGGAGEIAGSKAGTGTVRGMVQKAPQAMRSAGEGTLDRDEIQKVINANIGAIQQCYERELTRKAGLSGKVSVEWVVGTSGSVDMARQSFSDLNSSDVVNCILGRIRTWKFPKPRGGKVTVTYPFVFRPVGF